MCICVCLLSSPLGVFGTLKVLKHLKSYQLVEYRKDCDLKRERFRVSEQFLTR